jgi:hypothetical protein
MVATTVHGQHPASFGNNAASFWAIPIARQPASQPTANKAPYFTQQQQQQQQQHRFVKERPE